MKDIGLDKIRAAISCITPLTDDEWELIRERTEGPVHVRKGELTVKQGDIARSIAFVESGAFRSYYVKEGVEINQQFYFENSWVKSFHSFLKQEPSRLCVEAMEDSMIYTLHHKDLMYLYSSSNTISTFGRLIMEYGLVHALERLESFLLSTPEERYHQLMAEHPHIFERVPLYHIASYLGITQPSLSRLRARISGRKQAIIT